MFALIIYLIIIAFGIKWLTCTMVRWHIYSGPSRSTRQPSDSYVKSQRTEPLPPLANEANNVHISISLTDMMKTDNTLPPVLNGKERMERRWFNWPWMKTTCYTNFNDNAGDATALVFHQNALPNCTSWTTKIDSKVFVPSHSLAHLFGCLTDSAVVRFRFWPKMKTGYNLIVCISGIKQTHN